MKRILCLVLFLAIIAGGYTQETKTAKELRKEASAKKKEKKEAEAQKLYLEVGRLLESRQFTLQAHFLKNRQGTRISVNPVLNFIQVDSCCAFLQIGSPQVVGHNAAGGISAEGMISKWKLDKNEKRKTYDIFMSVLLNFGTVDIFMSVNMNSFATATVSGLSSAQLTYDGDLLPTKYSDAHKGWTP